MSDVLDLRSALEQDRQQVLDLLETSRRLVLEVRAAHYWTTEALSSFHTLSGIGLNIQRMLAQISPYWDEGKNIFKRPEAVKLYKTAIGLWAALRPVRQKFNEQLDKRRRQRIMGEEYVEVAEISAEEIEQHIEEFSQRHAEMWTLFVDLGEAIAAIPAGLVPNLELPKGVAAPAAAAAVAPAASPAASVTPAPSAAGSTGAAPANPAPGSPAPLSDTPSASATAEPGAANAPSAGFVAESSSARVEDSSEGPHARLSLLPEPTAPAAAPPPEYGGSAPQGSASHPAKMELAPEPQAAEEERLQPQAEAEQLIASLSGRADSLPEAVIVEQPMAEAPSGISWPDEGLRPEAPSASAPPAAAPSPAAAPAPAPQLPPLTPEDQRASVDRLFGPQSRQSQEGPQGSGSDGRPRITWGGDV